MANAYRIEGPGTPAMFDTVATRAAARARDVNGSSEAVFLPETKAGWIPFLEELARSQFEKGQGIEPAAAVELATEALGEPQSISLSPRSSAKPDETEWKRMSREIRDRSDWAELVAKRIEEASGFELNAILEAAIAELTHRTDQLRKAGA